MPYNYKYVKRRNHPLSTPSGRIPLHRVVLYDKIGPGPHPCHWGCGTDINWSPGEGTHAGSLIADHVDRNTLNNDPENLVPSCQSCNIHRHRSDRVRDDEIFVEVNGKRCRAVEKECERALCPNIFRVRIAETRPNRGRFCSRSCARRQPRRT